MDAFVDIVMVKCYSNRRNQYLSTFKIASEVERGMWRRRHTKIIRTLFSFLFRFGKLIRLQYGGRQLRGAEIDTYLLEKTRVTHQPERERNFHIFYQVIEASTGSFVVRNYEDRTEINKASVKYIETTDYFFFLCYFLQVLAGVRAKLLSDSMLEGEERFAILPGETTTADLVSFRETLHAFRQLNFTAEQQKQIFQVRESVVTMRVFLRMCRGSISSEITLKGISVLVCRLRC